MEVPRIWDITEEYSIPNTTRNRKRKEQESLPLGIQKELQTSPANRSLVVPLALRIAQHTLRASSTESRMTQAHHRHRFLPSSDVYYLSSSRPSVISVFSIGSSALEVGVLNKGTVEAVGPAASGSGLAVSYSNDLMSL